MYNDKKLVIFATRHDWKPVIRSFGAINSISLGIVINVPPAHLAHDVKEQEEDDDTVNAIEYGEQFRDWLGGEKIAVSYCRQGNDYKIERVQPTPSLQPMI